MRGIAFFGVAAALASGCATTPAWAPIIDTKGVDQAKYARDYAECRAYAEANPNANATEEQKRSGVRGGLMGAAIAGAAIVGTGGLAAIPLGAGVVASNAAAGAAAGAYGGKAIADFHYKGTITTCLKGRGYSVLG